MKYRVLNINRAVAAAGAFAVGTAGLHGANVTGLTPQEISKWWIVSGSLRSFYDDNSFNQPDFLAEASFGMEVKPGVAFNLPGNRTLLSASYDLTLNYFESRPNHKIDQTHFFDGRLNHKFSERYDVDFTETFVMSDEPAVIDKNGATPVFRRADDYSNIRNQFAVDVSGYLSSVQSLVVGYKNSYTDYESKLYSQSLDQVEHSFHLDSRWLSSEHTLLYLGYQIALADYFVPTLITFDDLEEIYPSIRNYRSHFVYVGGKQTLGRQLEANWQVGVQYSDYYNSGTTAWSPFVDASATYTYARESTIRLGTGISKYPVNVPIISSDVTLDQQVYNIGLSISHRIAARLTGNARLQYQHAIYNGGGSGLAGRSEDSYTFNLGVDYKIRENLWANMAYAYSTLTSGRVGAEFLNFSRNIIYLGVRASY